MKYLITGAKGQLGQEIVEYLNQKKADFAAYGSKDLDITDQKQVEAVFYDQKPDFVIDAAAYTKVDLAEDKGKERNWSVNFQGTKNLVEAAKKNSAGFVYISTDYVFDGKKKGKYSETDPTAPKNEYGKAKLAGEKAVLNSGIEAYIIRTSWVFGQYGNNFVYTMQRLAEEHPILTVVDDQIGRPTWTRSLTEFIFHLIEKKAEFGLYNFSNAGQTSWYEFAQQILKDKAVTVEPIDSNSFPQKAYRPPYSVLDLQKAKGTGFEIIDWQTALEKSGMMD
ncbi:dTDP-4-dehydrorhamnose reductase [Oenococcus alcoholitolerans]|uniref:dTDP-4-dehydrorhamnose reductase n=1 Tax=Oenococcus alcoholitolerans TaxID=931074 RepID=A0ABR4XSX2_9LACO|nr:dTDP-4-dehydrorhamnose reductase [Oenococcus alcoholitolerans]